MAFFLKKLQLFLTRASSKYISQCPLEHTLHRIMSKKWIRPANRNEEIEIVGKKIQGLLRGKCATEIKA